MTDADGTLRRRAARSAAAAWGWVRSRVVDPDTSYRRRLEAVVDGRPGAVVVVLAAAPGGAVADWARRRGATVHELVPAREPALHLRLAALGPLDVLAVDKAAADDRLGLVVATLRHLRPGGAVLVKDVAAGDDGGPEEAALSAWLGAPPAGTRDDDNGEDDDAALARTQVEVERFSGHAQVTHPGHALLKVREEEANHYLELAGPQVGRVLESRPGGRWQTRAAVRASGDAPRTLPDAYSPPDLNLREYADVLCLPGQVAVQDGVLLPDSFRHNQRKVLKNQRIRPLGEPFAVPEEIDAEPEHLAGAYFYLDSSYRGHFGHAMTEQLSRLWAWRKAKESHPDLKALLLEERRKGLHTFEKDLYAAAGVPVEDLVLASGPVRVERLLGATPMFSQPQYVHPGIEEVWSATSDALDARATGGPYPSRLFCARRHRKRACQNREEVEALFAEHGFAIVYTEDHPMPEQARMFRQADVVAGEAGSALFNLLFSASAKQVVMIASESYWAQNEYMIASVLGHDMTIAWCRPKRRTKPGQGFDVKTFQSPFWFDPDREGRLVRDVLAAL